MKKLGALIIAIGMTTVMSVNANPLKDSYSVTYASQEKVAVKPEELPEPVKTTLAGDAFAGWSASSAFLVTKADNSQYYEITLKKGTETANINLDKDGKKVE